MSSVVPDGWVDSPLGKFLKFRRGTSYVASELSEDAYSHPLYITMKSFKVGGGYSVRGDKYYSPPYDQKQVVEHDEILFANTDVTSSCDILGAPLLLPRKRLRADVLFSHHVTAAKILENVDKDFLFYLLSSPSVRQVVQSCGRGTTVKMLDMKDIGKLSFSLPPLPEQKKIASILTSVDEVIENTQKQIDKLQDLKKATMNELLTKGIGHTEFKDSELGRIPKSWDIVMFQDVFESYSYGPRFSSKDYSSKGNVQTIRGTDLSKDWTINYTQVPLAKLEEKLVAQHRLQSNDIVMITTADCGFSAVFNEQKIPFIASAYAIRLRPKQMLNSSYCVFYLQTPAAKEQIEKYERKGTVSNLPGSDVMKVKLPLPTMTEQKNIVAALNSIEVILLEKLGKLAQIQSLKKSLMQDLLTGKVRVTVN